MQPLTRKVEDLIVLRKILIVDDEHYTRKVIRTLLMSIGARHIYEASDGAAGLDVIRSVSPDIVLVDWEMPGLDGPGFVRAVRSPKTFCHAEIRIIMRTGYGERSLVVAAAVVVRHEYVG